MPPKQTHIQKTTTEAAMSSAATPTTPPDVPVDKVRSAESAVAFLQAEHRAVLEGLHHEIAGLQQKCSGKSCTNST